MGAAEQQKFSQYPYQYGDGLRGAALAQTRNGKDELITPIAFWELDAATGLYMPPGMSSNPRKPRVEATLTGRTVSIGGQTYEFDPPRTLYGLAASRPSAAAAHAVVPFALYVSADTKTIEMTDGTTWRRWGVF